MAVNQFETDFIAAESDTSADGHNFRAAMGKMLVNSLKDPSPGGGNDVLVAAAEKAFDSRSAALVTAMENALIANPALAALLYQRIADGVWEQLSKYGVQVGYNPKH